MIYPYYFTDIVRLVGGKDDSQGRVEVYNNGKWGTICNDSWSDNDAIVVCRSLGFIDGAISRSISRFGPGSGEILLNNVACLGTESRLQDCDHYSRGLENCNHLKDAGVFCFSGKNFPCLLFLQPGLSWVWLLQRRCTMKARIFQCYYHIFIFE